MSSGETRRLDYIPVTFTLGAAGVDTATRLGTGQKWLNGPLTLVGPRAEIQGPGGAYLRSTGTDPADAVIELRLTGAVDDSKIQLTQTTLTLEGGTAVNVAANDGGDVTISSKTRVASDADPTPSSTSHAFQVGTPGTSAGDFQLKVGPRQIMATEGDLTSSLNLNDDGGAVLVRGRQVAPIRRISTPIAGSSPNEASTTQEFGFQAGEGTATFTAGTATFTLPFAFPNGLLSFVAFLYRDNANSEYAFGYDTAVTTSASQVKLWLRFGGAAFSGSTAFSYIAIGW